MMTRITIFEFGVFVVFLASMVSAQQPDLYMHKIMSNVKNYTEFCGLMSMSPYECENVVINSEPVNGVDETGEKMLVGGTSQLAQFDACNPREQTVALPRHPDPDITIWPSCTRAMRCGGCCTSDMFSCEPTEIREKFVKVFDTRLPYPGAHRFRFLGVRAVKIIEHVQCDAQCKIKKHECHKYQMYEARRCRCVCRPEMLIHKNSCENNQIWDDQECGCICPNRNTIKCPEPSYFNKDTCKCTLKTSVTGEIDLDKLFEQLDKGLIGSDMLLDNQKSSKDEERDIDAIAGMKGTKVQVKEFGESLEDIGEKGEADEEEKVNDVKPKTMSFGVVENFQKEKEEKVVVKNENQEKKPPVKTVSNPCKDKKCFGMWEARLLDNGRCQCFPPRRFG
ncbi:balbiani ring protein 3-like [Ruditapes philippinarum]|uniref:balbiani ring protein 3-like n=1 Tax=Ruditapes philippinarum TaxID=129788 RepID=UPI00295BD6A2|nr:balbiani ring protein 3-like [Ruditapes philippinarum]